MTGQVIRGTDWLLLLGGDMKQRPAAGAATGQARGAGEHGIYIPPRKPKRGDRGQVAFELDTEERPGLAEDLRDWCSEIKWKQVHYIRWLISYGIANKLRPPTQE